MLGVLKAGGAYVPLDPAYPAERLAFMLADARAPVLLTQAALAGRCRHGVARGAAWTRDWTRSAGDAIGVRRRSRADHLAYVIYTSGSTGRPRACR